MNSSVVRLAVVALGAGVTSPLTAFSRILNPAVTFGVVRDGQLITEGGGFVNPSIMLSATH